VNVGAQEGVIEKSFAETYVQSQDAARAARTSLGELDRLEEALSNDSVYSGAGGELILKAKKVGALLGMDVEGVPDSEVIRALGSQMALKLRNPAGGAGMPGALSDKDREFLVSMTPGLGQTKAGNLLMIEAARRVAERDLEVARLARQYRRDNGKMDAGFYDLLDATFGDGDLFIGMNVPVTGALPPDPRRR